MLASRRAWQRAFRTLVLVAVLCGTACTRPVGAQRVATQIVDPPSSPAKVIETADWVSPPPQPVTSLGPAVTEFMPQTPASVVSGAGPLATCLVRHLETCVGVPKEQQPTVCKSLDWAFDCIKMYDCDYGKEKSKTSCVDVIWLTTATDGDCSATCRRSMLEPVRGENMGVDHDTTLCAYPADGKLWPGTKRLSPSACQVIAAQGSQVRTIATASGYYCGCLMPKQFSMPPRPDGLWTWTAEEECPYGMSPVPRLCRARIGEEYYFGWAYSGMCTMYWPASGENAVPRSTTLFGRLCVPNRFSYLHDCEEDS